MLLTPWSGLPGLRRCRESVSERLKGCVSEREREGGEVYTKEVEGI